MDCCGSRAGEKKFQDAAPERGICSCALSCPEQAKSPSSHLKEDGFHSRVTTSIYLRLTVRASKSTPKTGYTLIAITVNFRRSLNAKRLGAPLQSHFPLFPNPSPLSIRRLSAGFAGTAYFLFHSVFSIHLRIAL